MPVLRTFRGRPVYSRRKLSRGYRVKLVKPWPHLARESFIVSEEEWREHRRVQIFSIAEMPNVELLARQHYTSSTPIFEPKPTLLENTL